MRALAVCSFALSLAFAPTLTSCEDLNRPNGSRTLDEPFFRCRVQPIITKGCGQLLCHGDARRYFHVFGRSRLRLGGTEEQRNAFLTDAERTFNYRAASALVVPGQPERSWLLMKPLEPSAGGWYHVGAVRPFHGGDVYSSTSDPEWRVMRDWVMGATEDPSCIEPGSDI